jgi:hypothetical protein
MVMAVHQCPRCQLRFSFRTELEFHLREDHDQSDRAADVREPTGPVTRAALVLPDGRNSDPMLATTASAQAESPVVGQRPTRTHRSDVGVIAATSVDHSDHDHHVDGEPLPTVTLMPRRVTMAVIVIVITVLGLGAVLGS